ncbi:MAG: hypothetical protein ABUT20_29975 [Bacteroidota bacterium]
MKQTLVLINLSILLAFISCKKKDSPVTSPSPCDVVSITHDPQFPRIWSPDRTKFLVNKLDANGVYQIYVGHATDTSLTCISLNYSFSLLRPWKDRQKMQVQWHPSGNFIICAVEKEFYPELLYTPYELRLGWLQSGIWMDVWATTPDGNNWYQLAVTERGVTGPAFTPDGKKAAWAEALNNGNIFVDVFGVWKLRLSNFAVNNNIPSFTSTADISPQGSRWLEPGNFAPDGRSLLLNSDIGMTNAEGQDQYILDIMTGQITNLTNSPKIWDEHGVFSPDGKKILFMSSYPYRADTNSYHTLSIKTEFMLINKDGSNLQQLTHFRTPGYPEYHNGIAAIGFFTPDGSTIYGQSLNFPYMENWIIKFSGSCGKQ